MTVNRKELLEKLRLAFWGVEKDNVFIDGADAFVFREGKLYTYNDSVFVQLPCDMGGLNFAVSAKEFLNFYSKAKSDDASIDLVNGQIVMKAGKTAVRMTNIPEHITSTINGLRVDELQWQLLPKSFINGLSRVNIKCSFLKQDDRAKIQGVYCYGNTLMSTDSIQCNILELEYAAFNERALWLSDKTVDILAKFDLTEMSITDQNRVFFRGEGVTVAVKKFVDTYPRANIRDNIYSYKPLTGNVRLGDAFFETLSRAVSFAGDADGESIVSLEFKDKDGAIPASSAIIRVKKAAGDFEEETDVDGYVSAGKYEFDGKRLLHVNKLCAGVLLSVATLTQKGVTRCALFCTDNNFTAFIAGKTMA